MRRQAAKPPKTMGDGATRSMALAGALCIVLAATAFGEDAAEPGGDDGVAAEPPTAEIEESREAPAEKTAGTTAREVAEGAADVAEKAVLNLRADLVNFPFRLWKNVGSLPTLENFVILGGAGALSVVADRNWDRDVRREVARNRRRLGSELNHFLDNSGRTGVHLIGAATLYGSSLFFQYRPFHEFSLDVMHSLALEIPITMGLKSAIDTERPNEDDKGFPSGHVGSSFAIAAAVHENFGIWPGMAAYGWGTLVALHRLDTQNHDLSDVIFGAAIGYVVGRSVSRNEALQVAGVSLRPFLDFEERGGGVGIEYRF